MSKKGGVTKTATVQSQSACTNAIQSELGAGKTGTRLKHMGKQLSITNSYIHSMTKTVGTP